jgi:hypothetical protein
MNNFITEMIIFIAFVLIMPLFYKQQKNGKTHHLQMSMLFQPTCKIGTCNSLSLKYLKTRTDGY